MNNNLLYHDKANGILFLISYNANSEEIHIMALPDSYPNPVKEDS